MNQAQEAYEFMDIYVSTTASSSRAMEVNGLVLLSVSPWVHSSFGTSRRRSGWDWASTSCSGGLGNVTNTFFHWFFLFLCLSLVPHYCSLDFNLPQVLFQFDFQENPRFLNNYVCLLRTRSHSLQDGGITFREHMRYHSDMNSVRSFVLLNLLTSLPAF